MEDCVGLKSITIVPTEKFNIVNSTHTQFPTLSPLRVTSYWSEQKVDTTSKKEQFILEQCT